MSQSQLKQIARGEAPQSSAKDRMQAFRSQLDNMHPELRKILGPRVSVDQFIGAAWAAVLQNPGLVDADRLSFFSALRKAANDGLVPDGREAVLNVYNTKQKFGDDDWRWVKKVEFLPMVGGLVKKLYESGEVTYLDAAAVFELDHFAFRRGDAPAIEHEPYLGTEDPGEIVAAYAIVKLRNGETKREVMGRRDLDKVRAASKSADKGPWSGWNDQMAIKSVIKRAYKQLPHTPTVDRLIDIDNAVSFGAGDDSQAQPGALPHAAAPALNFDPGTTIGDLAGQQQAEAVRVTVTTDPGPGADAGDRVPGSDDDRA
jgi:recombination protein RecT